ncbi:hypothetical protein AAZV13_02G016201 [Glycine max]
MRASAKVISYTHPSLYLSYPNIESFVWNNLIRANTRNRVEIVSASTVSLPSHAPPCRASRSSYLPIPSSIHQHPSSRSPASRSNLPPWSCQRPFCSNLSHKHVFFTWHPHLCPPSVRRNYSARLTLLERHHPRKCQSGHDSHCAETVRSNAS